jgi:hypothetical protein
MLLTVILNLVLAVMIVSAIVALHARAIFTDRVHRERPLVRERHPRVQPAEPWPARQRPPRTTRQPVSSAG